MRHLSSGRKLGRTYTHRNALLANLATSLIIAEQKSIKTTLAKAKELRPYVEKLISKAKRAYSRERATSAEQGFVDVHQRREVGRVIRNKGAVQILFDDIAPTVVDRAGGYTRIIKLGQRRGDGSEQAIIQLVDWSAPQDGSVSSRSRKNRAGKKRDTKSVAKTSEPTNVSTAPEQVVDSSAVAPVAEPPVVHPEIAEVIAETSDTTETNQEPKQETQAS